MKYFLFAFLLVLNCFDVLADETQPDKAIDEIVVTAEFNHDNPFNLPMSVSVLSSDDINQRLSLIHI